MSERQLQKARKRYGEHAVVKKEKATEYDDGRCRACLQRGCRRAWKMSVGIRILGGLMFSVHGTGHTWKEAWEKADRHDGVVK